MLNLLTVVGARPQFVKAAVLSRFRVPDEYPALYGDGHCAKKIVSYLH